MSIHGADNAAKDWLPDWKEMLGGIFSHVGLPDGKTKKGEFTVKIADTASPITQGLKDFALKDELYYQMQLQPDVQPLATIEYQGVAWPVAWTRTFGKGGSFIQTSATATSAQARTTPPQPQPGAADHSGRRLDRGRADRTRQAMNQRFQSGRHLEDHHILIGKDRRS